MCKSLSSQVLTTSEFLIQEVLDPFPNTNYRIVKRRKVNPFFLSFLFLHPMGNSEYFSPESKIRRKECPSRTNRVNKKSTPNRKENTHPTGGARSTAETCIRWYVPTPITTDLYLFSEYNVDQSRFFTINPSDKQTPRFFRLRASAETAGGGVHVYRKTFYTHADSPVMF